jgi:hypothetical protein
VEKLFHGSPVGASSSLARKAVEKKMKMNYKNGFYGLLFFILAIVVTTFLVGSIVVIGNTFGTGYAIIAFGLFLATVCFFLFSIE